MPTLSIEDQRNSPSDPPPPGPKALTGEQIIGKYRLVRDLGTGGMARVFLASLDGPDGFAKPYVLKRILPEYARDEQFAQMFAIEAKVASMLSHPNIVNVFEFAVEKDDYYLVLEYVAGASLDRIVHAARKQGTALGAQVAVEIGLGLARALAYAHGLVLPNGTPLELVHRDISPGNVLVSYDGSVKLTDFGVVKTSVTATVAGVVKGKWSYMSPEQISSQPVDRRSDLFSLGVVLYELATGQRLFRGDSIGATALRVMKATVPPPRTIAPDFDLRLEAILLKMLARDPSARYQSADELLSDLEAFRASRPNFGPAALGSLVRSLFPDDGSSSGRFVSFGDQGSGLISLAGLPKPPPVPFEEDVKVDFEPDADEAALSDRISPLFAAVIAATCLVASAIFWFVVL